MKKLLALTFAIMIVLLAGCSPEPLEWRVSDELDNGLFTLVPEMEAEEHEWYTVVDTEADELLSLGLIYPDEYGVPTTSECKVGGKTTTCETESWDRDGGGVLFYILSTEDFNLDSTKTIKITQNFQNKTVTIEFTPERIKAALNKE